MTLFPVIQPEYQIEPRVICHVDCAMLPRPYTVVERCNCLTNKKSLHLNILHYQASMKPGVTVSQYRWIDDVHHLSYVYFPFKITFKDANARSKYKKPITSSIYLVMMRVHMS